MNRVTRLLRRGWTVLREEGPGEFVKRSREYLNRVSVSGRGVTISYQTGARVDFEERWGLLSEAIDPDASTLLDIGCAEGDLTARFADRGLLSIGIERQAHSVANARAVNGDRMNLAFLQYEVTPETIDSLPSVDVVLLLTVYHHWVAEYGHEDAERMLRTLGEKCDTLCFEMPNRPVDRPPLSVDTGDSTVEYYTAYLNTIYDGDATVDHLGTTDYKGGDRTDLIFAIDFDE